jgi:hypothetical protein
MQKYKYLNLKYKINYHLLKKFNIFFREFFITFHNYFYLFINLLNTYYKIPPFLKILNFNWCI